jgi:hypothetical protein
MWIPAHVGIAGNGRVDFEARWATFGNMVYNAQSVARDLLPIAKQRMTEKLGRPWFEEWRTESELITTVSRIISGTAGLEPT